MIDTNHYSVDESTFRMPKSFQHMHLHNNYHAAIYIGIKKLDVYLDAYIR